MKGNDLKPLIETYIRAEIEPETLVLMINECLDAIGDQALLHKNIEVILNANEWQNLPNNVTAVIEVTNSNGELYTDWQTLGSLIKVLDSGGYHITARMLTPHISSLDEEIEIHALFNYAILCYLRGISKKADDDMSQDGSEQLQMFLAGVQKAHETLLGMRAQ